MRYSRFSRLVPFLTAFLVVWTAALAQAATAVEAVSRFTPTERRELHELAERTWKCLEASSDTVSGFAADHLERLADGKVARADYTTATNIGLQLMAIPAAHDLGLIRARDERRRMARLLAVLETMPAAHGLFYNYFKTVDGSPDPKRFVSSVDNAWLAAGLWVAAQTGDRALRARALALYRAMDFIPLYDPALGLFSLGYSEADATSSTAHYGQLCTEARIISTVAIGKGQVPPSHWYRLHRTLPADWAWQSQAPRGQAAVSPDGTQYFQGVYEVGGTAIVPSWGGSLFEFLMPLLVLPELELARSGLGENDRRAARLQKEYALQTAGYPVWGLSPCSGVETDGYRYHEAGMAALGAKGYPDEGLVTPYASLLALEIDPDGVLRNIRAFQRHYKIWTPYGFADSVEVKTGAVAQRFLTLDQAMIFLSLHNALKDGKTRKRFFSGEIEERVAPLLKEEKFF